MIGKMVANAVTYDKARAADVERIWAMLTGELTLAEIDRLRKPEARRPGKAEINMVFGV